MKIFITRKIQPIAKELLTNEGFEVTVFNKNRPITKKELLTKAKDADAIIALLTEKFDKEVIDRLPNCKIIANFAVGYNNINVEYANQKGIIVTNTPDVLTEATAETAVSLILACAKRIPEVDKFVREGKFKGWEPELFLGVELKNKTVGIVGAGRIGFETAKRIKAFDTKIIYYNRSKKENFENELNAKKVSLNKLLKTADIISLHIPLSKETHHLLDKNKLQLLKPTAILVNTARGEIVDEKYLIKMLKKKKIFSAGFDVYENEPNLNKELFKLNNVVLLPHIGSATNESRSAIAKLAARNVINVLKGKKPITPVKI